MAKDFVTPEQYQRGVGKIKDYVDNLSVIAPLDSTSNDEYVKVNLEDLELTKTYIVPKGRYIGILVTKNDGTKQSVLVVSNTCFSIYVVSGNKGTANRIFYYTTNFGSYKVNVTSNIDNNGQYIIKQEAFVLGADNLIEYNPQTPYSPATKKYVDDKSPFKSITSTANNIITINELQTDNLYELNGSFKMFPSSESVNLSGLFIFENIDNNTKALRKINNNGNITTTSYVLNVNAQTYTINKTQEINYLTPESSCIYLENVRSGIYSTAALSARVNKSNNTSVALGVAGIKYLAITKASYNGDTIWTISVLSSNISNSELTLKSDGTVIAKYYQYQTDENVLTKINTIEYTPIKDYHPATKKYVDDTAETLVKKDTNKYVLITNDDTLVIKKDSITDISDPTITIDNLTGQFGTLVANDDGTYSYTLNTIMTDVEIFTFKVNDVEQKLVIVPYREMTYDDGNGGITYNGTGWNIEEDENHYKGKAHKSVKKGDALTFNFKGTGLSILCKCAPDTDIIYYRIIGSGGGTTITTSEKTYYQSNIFTKKDYNAYTFNYTSLLDESNNAYNYFDSFIIYDTLGTNLNDSIRKLYYELDNSIGVLRTDKENFVFNPTRLYDPTTKKYVDDLIENSKTTMCTDEEVDNMLIEVLGGDYIGN